MRLVRGIKKTMLLFVAGMVVMLGIFPTSGSHASGRDTMIIFQMTVQGITTDCSVRREGLFDFQIKESLYPFRQFSGVGQVDSCGESIQYHDLPVPMDVRIRVKPFKNLAVCYSNPVTIWDRSIISTYNHSAGDANNDNVVDAVDYNIVQASFGCTWNHSCYDNRADFNNDQIVDVVDFNLMRGNYGRMGCSI